MHQIPQGCVIEDIEDLGVSSIIYASELSSASEKQLPWVNDHETLHSDGAKSKKSSFSIKLANQIKKLRKINGILPNIKTPVAESKNRGKLASYNIKVAGVSQKANIEREKANDDCILMKLFSKNMGKASPKILTNLRSRSSNFFNHFNVDKEFELFQSAEVKKRPFLDLEIRRSINKVDDLKAVLTKKIVKKKFTFKSSASTDCNTIITADCTPIKVDGAKTSGKPGKFLYSPILPASKCKNKELKKSVWILNLRGNASSVLKLSKTSRGNSKDKPNSSSKALTIRAPLKKLKVKNSLKINKKLSNKGKNSSKKKQRCLKTKKKRKHSQVQSQRRPEQGSRRKIKESSHMYI
ncbi:unnamed protein product [Moneuplotes crassus]|uniref:Uncharacterized protein n=1 Tax=Euplotes crassus TaxID=5936 RepID=A0AAD1UPR2_EUPCR|nr:unnamed protein product [Moneuplotes crassus]